MDRRSGFGESTKQQVSKSVTDGFGRQFAIGVVPAAEVVDAPEELMRREVRGDRRRFHERFRMLIEQGQTEGSLRSDVSADLVAHQFFGGVHHLGSWYHADGELTPESIGAAFADLLLRGIGGY